MVRSFIYSLLFFQALAFSAEFTASVNQTEVSIHEGIQLQLTLEGASAKSAPNLEALNSNFQIQSKQQLNNTSIINGKLSAKQIWKLSLIPLKDGALTIPPINIATSDGTLTSNPLVIQVSTTTKNTGIEVKSKVSRENPYKNEPIIFTVTVSSSKKLVNIHPPAIPALDEAIIEGYGEPKVYSNAVEFTYLITPLSKGPLKIPPMTIQGAIPVERKANSGGFFDEDVNFFSFVQGFDRLEPFSYSSDEHLIHVQPAVSGITPWLPAENIVIEEVINDKEPFKVGEPFTRTFTIQATGIKSNQLPSLKEFLNQGIKAYADKPEMQDEIVNGKLKATKKEHYTLIPEQGGELTLPEIAIPFWDVVKKEKKIAKIPAKTIQVFPIKEQAPSFTPPQEILHVDSPSNLWPFLILLSILFIGSIIWIVLLLYKLRDLKTQKRYNPFLENNEKVKKNKLKDINPT